ncbi:hypothetical protein [Pseudomarimonas salicorniae]|uniref:Uncharacterized protein n=1 Tax=Pseudomarimonas salicorniae TaxID=2933270 RepID=A0ABT0GF13_9GAMM|nr:hypothetical protein [Lysobacter sp. CAU 1642]MCK7593137.1 hypothetical protein [Lysobacter sp. CAU 1642]
MARFVFRRDHEASRHFFEVPEVARPDGATTQWLCFRFRSEGMQAASPASHFAVVLRAELGRDAEGVPRTISGRGLTWGDTSQALRPASFPGAPGDRFGGARGAQIESFWPGGNFLFREARLLDEGLRDEVDYRVHLHVRDDGWCGFWLADDRGQPLPGQSASVRDHPGHPVIAGRSGVVIALGRGAETGADWEAQFEDLAWGWF